MTCAARWLTVVALLSVPHAFADEPWLILPPSAGHFAVDLTSTLPGSTLSELDAIGGRIDRAGAGQLGVLVLRTTSGVAPRIFATHVFNHWGIGHQARNDGVFVMVALDDRKAELVVGKSNPLSREVTDAIMRDDIVSNMKRKDPAGAVVAAAKSIERALGGSSPQPVAALEVAVAAPDQLGPFVRGERAFPDFTPRRFVIDLPEVMSASDRAQLEIESAALYGEGKGRLVFLHVATAATWPSLEDGAEVLERQLGVAGGPVAIVAFNSANNVAVLRLGARGPRERWEERQVSEALTRMQAATSPLEALSVGGQFAAQALRTGIPPRPVSAVLEQAFEQFKVQISVVLALFSGLGVFLFKRWNRTRSRSCATCGQPRERLSEHADDAHLSTGQREEENLGSIDYDVWWCGRCNDPLVISYSAFFSRYRSCRKCTFKTATSSSTTLRYATEYSEGEVEVTTRCSHCGDVSVSTHYTARLEPSSSSSDSSSSSSSSYDGGFSSGDGSSGSW